MDYKKQVESIEEYFRVNEKDVNNFKIGVEFEHFVIDLDTFKTMSYYGEAGVAETLKDLEGLGYEGVYENDYILGLNKGRKHITLEPGSQLELSIDASKHIGELEKDYLEFLEDIIPILKKKNQGLMATGYHPVTKIDKIKLLPKQRYDYMFDYFKTRGTHAHNMMKGTAALQVALDYKSEEDYRKKFQITNALSPVLYSIFENAYYFEGQPIEKHNIRAHIWKNCDSHRSGVAEGALDKDYNYKTYAEYILNRPPIFINKDGREVFTGSKTVRELYDPDKFSTGELEHLLTMFFPDVRTKKYIEIRMMDSIPYPLNFSAIGLLVGLLYNEENVNELYDFIQDISIEDVENAKIDMGNLGLQAKLKEKSLLEIGRYLLDLARKGLESKDAKYLEPLSHMLDIEKSPYDITRGKSKEGRKQSLDWCLLKEIGEEK